MSRVGHVLEGLGISDMAEHIYCYLLGRPATTMADITEGLSLSRAEVRATLKTLEAKGLVNRSPTRPPRYVPSPPEAAIEILVLKHQEQLEQARLAAAELGETFRKASQEARLVDLVEVIVGQDAIAQRYLQMELSVRHELLVVDSPPYATTRKRPDEFEPLKRGARGRTIYARETFELPGELDWARSLAAAGDECRVASEVLTKLAVADGQVALIPLSVDEHVVESAVVVHHSLLLDIVIAFFESAWERAVPLRDWKLDSTEKKASHPDVLGIDRLVGMLAAGAKDASIARALGVSPSTVDRRIRNLMKELGVRTRFQAGLVIGEKGLASQSHDDVDD